MKASDLPLNYNAVEILERNLAARGDKVALYSLERELTFRQAGDEVNRLGNALIKLDVRLGETVAILAPDSAEFVCAYFAALKIGAVAASVNTLLKPQELDYILRDARARVLVAHQALLPSLRPIWNQLDQVEHLIVDPRVKAVTLTGSERAGSAVASAAAREIKKAVLELGGSDAFIVMPSADFKAALTTAVKARTINSGQSCIAAKRFFIADKVYDDFLRQFVERMRALKIGDPLDETTEIGPLATEQILNGVHDQVQKSVVAGAKLLTGGNRIHGPGFFYEPTVLVNVPRNSPAYREEVFGPVASIFRVRDVADAIEIANDSPFGLGASAWTGDPTEKELFASELDAGVVFINGMVASDPRLPFGGVKRSGFGRELGAAGIREFTNIKTIWIS